jgi:hypothetical protein
MRSGFTFDEIDALTGGRIGVFDTACPRCSPHHQRLRIFRIWRIGEHFANFQLHTSSTEFLPNKQESTTGRIPAKQQL